MYNSCSDYNSIVEIERTQIGVYSNPSADYIVVELDEQIEAITATSSLG
ncbi:MAG: hypothetical protein HRT71_09085 [Flavobacteriales bacterium]|nr:hypothetical protein [Flavobacteriales bacterium]